MWPVGERWPRPAISSTRPRASSSEMLLRLLLLLPHRREEDEVVEDEEDQEKRHHLEKRRGSAGRRSALEEREVHRESFPRPGEAGNPDAQVSNRVAARASRIPRIKSRIAWRLWTVIKVAAVGSPET